MVVHTIHGGEHILGVLVHDLLDGGLDSGGDDHDSVFVCMIVTLTMRPEYLITAVYSMFITLSHNSGINFLCISLIMNACAT